VLLDTHVWIWMVTDAGRHLGPRTRRLLSRAGPAHPPCISTVSLLEICALHTSGRLLFTQPIEGWIRESIGSAGLRVLDLGLSCAIDAGLIPAVALADPIDRMLVATARESQLPLVTRDRRLLDYASRTGAVRVVDASR
jgi:PIN domain nuclease of toxin-antitoxin system